MFELGNNLRDARQGRRIDLVIAEQDTKIRSKYLAALEAEDFDILPGPVFVRGFLRTYSRYLGLDPQMFVDEYNARFGRFEEVEEHGVTPALGRPGLVQERVNRGRRAMRMFVIVSLVALAGLAWLGLRASDEPAPADVEPRATTATTPASTSPEPSLEDAVAGASADATDAPRTARGSSRRTRTDAEDATAASAR